MQFNKRVKEKKMWNEMKRHVMVARKLQWEKRRCKFSCFFNGNSENTMRMHPRLRKSLKVCLFLCLCAIFVRVVKRARTERVRRRLTAYFVCPWSQLAIHIGLSFYLPSLWPSLSLCSSSCLLAVRLSARLSERNGATCIPEAIRASVPLVHFLRPCVSLCAYLTAHQAQKTPELLPRSWKSLPDGDIDARSRIRR